MCMVPGCGRGRGRRLTLPSAVPSVGQRDGVGGRASRGLLRQRGGNQIRRRRVPGCDGWAPELWKCHWGGSLGSVGTGGPGVGVLPTVSGGGGGQASVALPVVARLGCAIERALEAPE